MENKDNIITKEPEYLSENELAEITDYLSNNVDEKSNNLREIISEEDDFKLDGEFEDIEEAVVNMNINGITGLPDQISTMTVAEDEDYEKNLASTYNMSDDEVIQMMSVIRRYKNKEDFNIYEELPLKFKQLISAQLLMTTTDPYNKRSGKKKMLNEMATMLIDQFIADSNLDKEFDAFTQNLQNEMNIPSIEELYSDYTKVTMETELLAKADSLEAEQPDAAAKLRKLSAIFTASYTFSTLKEFILANRKVRNRLTRDLKDMEKYVRDFNIRMKNCDLNIYDISYLPHIMMRALPDVEPEGMAKFILAFIKMALDGNIKDIFHASLVYYTIRNIMTLDYIDQEKTGEFSKEIIDNLKQIILDIQEIDNQHKEGEK